MFKLFLLIGLKTDIANDQNLQAYIESLLFQYFVDHINRIKFDFCLFPKVTNLISVEGFRVHLVVSVLICQIEENAER
jgi:hypothetical protein